MSLPVADRLFGLGRVAVLDARDPGGGEGGGAEPAAPLVYVIDPRPFRTAVRETHYQTERVASAGQIGAVGLALRDDGSIFMIKGKGANINQEPGLCRWRPLVQARAGFVADCLAYGAVHVVAIDIDGRAFAAGSNRFGQLGCGDQFPSEGLEGAWSAIPVPLATKVRLSHVACGAATTLVGSSSLGRLWQCGADLRFWPHVDGNYRTELTEVDCSAVAALMREDEDEAWGSDSGGTDALSPGALTGIAASDSACFLVASRVLAAWGSNELRNLPFEARFVERPSVVAAGVSHVAASDLTVAIAWDAGDDELRVGVLVEADDEGSMSPGVIRDFASRGVGARGPVADLACAHGSVYVCTRGGHLWVAGNNEAGRLGLDPELEGEHIDTLTEVRIAQVTNGEEHRIPIRGVDALPDGATAYGYRRRGVVRAQVRHGEMMAVVMAIAGTIK